MCQVTARKSVKALFCIRKFNFSFALAKIVCSCHIMYAFQIYSTLSSCLIVKESLPQSRRKIWSLSDCNWTRTHNHLVHKRTLNHLAKLARLVVGSSPVAVTKRLFIWILIIEFKLLLDYLDLISVLMSLKWLKIFPGWHMKLVFIYKFQLATWLVSSLLFPYLIYIICTKRLQVLHYWCQNSDTYNIHIQCTRFSRTLMKLIWILALIYTFHRFHRLCFIAVIT